MRNNEIRALFKKAEEQIQIDEIKKQETYHRMLETMEMQKTPMMPAKNILLHQIWYMDKVFWVIYGVLICLGIISITTLQYIGVKQNDMIIACMVGAGILSVVSISLIDKVFFGRMAELGESCYFNTKQCVAAWLVLSGMINIVVLLFMTAYLSYCQKVGLLQVALYILTPYLISNIAALGIFSIEKKGKRPSLFCMSSFFLSISYMVIGSIPKALLTTVLWIWGMVFLVSGFLLGIQIKKLLSKIEKGEILCMN